MYGIRFVCGFFYCYFFTRFGGGYKACFISLKGHISPIKALGICDHKLLLCYLKTGCGHKSVRTDIMKLGDQSWAYKASKPKLSTYNNKAINLHSGIIQGRSYLPPSKHWFCATCHHSGRES